MRRHLSNNMRQAKEVGASCRPSLPRAYGGYLRFMIFRSHQSIPGPGGMACPTGRMISGGRGIAGPAGGGFAFSVIVQILEGRGASKPLDETISRHHLK
jgi:hypothetical protein